MNKQIIHFAHANGFPAKTYNKLFSFLKDEFEINYLERHAHNPKYPVTDGWEFLAEELRAEIEKRYTRKIIGVGHSLGGILHFLVAVEKPELYRALVLLDAPIISRLTGTAIKVLKRAKLIDRFSPARGTHFRRTQWRGKTEAFEHFRSKEKFLSFDEEILRDYIEHGTFQNGDNIKLLFDPKVEAKIYQTLPDNFGKFRGKLKVPAAYIGGEFSREARLARLGFMRKKFDFDFYFIKGSHLYPFEKPEETARMIKLAISNLNA
jgi:pimeloyl-ACP methyl ester carboxylesterase